MQDELNFCIHVHCKIASLFLNWRGEQQNFSTVCHKPRICCDPKRSTASKIRKNRIILLGSRCECEIFTPWTNGKVFHPVWTTRRQPRLGTTDSEAWWPIPNLLNWFVRIFSSQQTSDHLRILYPDIKNITQCSVPYSVNPVVKLRVQVCTNFGKHIIWSVQLSHVCDRVQVWCGSPMLYIFTMTTP